MSEKYKPLNIEGDTYVIPGEEPYNEAEVKNSRDADWNDFQTMGDQGEAKYIPPKKVSKEGLARLKARRIDISILEAAAA